MRRIRIIVEYDGSAYVGWQTQPNGTAIQELIEKAVFETTGEYISLQGSGRTDSGVHARAQVAHFDTQARMSPDKFAFALNTRLPRDIRVLYSEEAPSDFHARFSAKNKQYRYCIQLGPHARVFTRERALHCHYRLNEELLSEAAEKYIGEHDFAGFMSSGTNIESTVRTITLSKWTKDGSYLYYDVAGNGFLYNMVRIIVGTMLEIGMGQRELSSIDTALSCGDRSFSGATAPAHGLTLWRVSYDGFDTERILESL